MKTITRQQIQDILDQELKLVDYFDAPYIDGENDAITRIMELVKPLNKLVVEIGELASCDILTQSGKAALLDFNYGIPPAPDSRCKKCKCPVVDPAAHHTGDGWALWWKCHCEETTIDIEWPFGDGWVGQDTLERAGFEIV